MSLSNNTVLAQTLNTTSLNLLDENDCRLVRADKNGVKVDISAVEDTIHALACELNTDIETSLKVIQAYAEAKLAEINNATEMKWKSNLPSSTVVHEGTTSRAEKNQPVNFH
ncbi:MAG: hypothetical protein ACI9TY_000945 [Alphaproteobacteria bacterium]|jgi:hypothetical protein